MKIREMIEQLSRLETQIGDVEVLAWVPGASSANETLAFAPFSAAYGRAVFATITGDIMLPPDAQGAAEVVAFAESMGGQVDDYQKTGSGVAPDGCRRATVAFRRREKYDAFVEAYGKKYGFSVLYTGGDDDEWEGPHAPDAPVLVLREKDRNCHQDRLVEYVVRND